MTVVGPHPAFGGIANLGSGELLLYFADLASHAANSSAGIRSFRSLDGGLTWAQDADVWLPASAIGGLQAPWTTYNTAGGGTPLKWSQLITDYGDNVTGGHNVTSVNNVKEACGFVTSQGTILVTSWNENQSPPVIFRSTDRGRTYVPCMTAKMGGSATTAPTAPPSGAGTNAASVYTAGNQIPTFTGNIIYDTGLISGSTGFNATAYTQPYSGATVAVDTPIGQMSGPVIEIGTGPGSTLLTTCFGPINQMTSAKGSVTVIKSTDDGKTWHYLSTPANADTLALGYGFAESNLVLLDNGTIYCMHRTGSSTPHRMYQTSTDNGATWSSLTVPYGIPGNVTGRPVTMQAANGDMLHLYRPNDYSRYMMLTVSHDRGANWTTPVIAAGCGLATQDPNGSTAGPQGLWVYGQMIETAPGSIACAYMLESSAVPPPGTAPPDSIGGWSTVFFRRITLT